MGENWMGYAEPPDDAGPEQGGPGCTCVGPDELTTEHAPWCGEVASDEVWTTAQCATVLGIGRGGVARTLLRRGVEALADPVKVGRGWTLQYRASEVWVAQQKRLEDGRGASAQAKVREGGKFSS